MKYLKLFEEYEQTVNEEKSFKGNTVKELLKAAKRKMGTESFLVQDMDGVDWAVFIDGDTKPGDREVYAMDQYDNEQMVQIKSINLIYEGRLVILSEAATLDYDPPKFLVLPALDPNGNGTPVDKIDAYMRAELAKSESYYKPGIRSANPPKNGDEVDRRLEDEMDESVNEGKEISKGKIDMMGSKILNRIKIGAKFVTDGGDYTVTGFGPKSNAFQEYEAEKDGKPCKVKLTAMYGVKLEVTDDPRSAVYRKEEMLNSIILESVMNKENTNMKMVKTFSEYSTINENRFKEGKGMFGYRIDPKRTKLKPEVIATLADVVKEFTEAYKSIEDRDRNIFDLTDALQKEIERFDKNYWRSLGWNEENVATTINDAFKNGLAAQKPNIKVITAMLSELPIDSSWG